MPERDDKPVFDDKIVRDQPIGMPSEQGPLAIYHGAQPPAPQWFEDAVGKPYETAFTTCEGARIHFQRWGDRSNCYRQAQSLLWGISPPSNGPSLI